MTRADGFINQRLCVVPRPAVDAALQRPVTRRLVVTDAGQFPDAQGHERYRPDGVEETIVIACTAGSGWIEIDGVRHRVAPSTVVVVGSGTPHRYGADNENPWTIWWCHLRGGDAAELTGATEVTRARPVLSLRAVDRVVALIDEIVSGLERDQSPARLVRTSGAAWKLMTVIATDRVTPEEGDPLHRAMAFLADRLDASMPVPELAALVGVSASHLSALFHRATGGGVLAHHTALRMSRARHLLDTTDTTVNQIAAETGYRDPFYFSRQFRKTHGVSPSAYREQRKG